MSNSPNPIDGYWQLRLKNLQETLEGNNFRVFIAANLQEAHDVVMEQIWPRVKPASISWGGSMTFMATGLYDELKVRDDVEVSIPSTSNFPWRR